MKDVLSIRISHILDPLEVQKRVLYTENIQTKIKESFQTLSNALRKDRPRNTV